MSRAVLTRAERIARLNDLTNLPMGTLDRTPNTKNRTANMCCSARLSSPRIAFLNLHQQSGRSSKLFLLVSSRSVLRYLPRVPVTTRILVSG